MDKDQIIQLRNHHLKQGRNNDRRPIYPITKAECIIGGAGGVQKVDTLPEKGEEGKVYYNTTEKKYYIYTEENGWSELGSGGSDGPVYEIKYQYNPMFCGNVNFDKLPSCLDAIGFIKEGTTIVINKDAEDDTEYSRDTMGSDIGYDNVYILGLGFEYEFANYLATLGIDWYNVDRSTISDITYSITVDLFDMRNLYDQGMSSIQDTWVVCKYTVNSEISVEEVNKVWKCVANGIVTSREYITSGTIVYPRMHIKYLMQPKEIVSGPNEEQIPTCGLAIDTMGICRGTVDSPLGTERHILGNSGFAFYNNISWDGNPIAIRNLEIIPRFGECDSTIFKFPLFDNLNIVGRFLASDTCRINIGNLIPAENNPDIENGCVYEYHIMHQVFSLIKLSTF